MEPDPPAPDPWQAVADECPRRADRYRHQAGHYTHWRLPSGALLCVRRDEMIPGGLVPSAAQEAGWRAFLADPPKEE